MTHTTTNALLNDMEHSLEYTSRQSIFMNQAKQKWIEKPYIYIANLLIWLGLWIFKLKPALGKLKFDFLKRIPFFKLLCLKEITSPYLHSLNIILSQISKLVLSTQIYDWNIYMKCSNFVYRICVAHKYTKDTFVTNIRSFINYFIYLCC